MTGGGFGALDSMNKTISNNRNLLRKKKGFEVLKENATWDSKRSHYTYKEASEDQLMAIRRKMTKRRWVNVLKGGIAMSVSLFLAYYLVLWYFGLL